MTELVNEVTIVYAGYGYLNQTIDVTNGIKTEFAEGARTFLATNRFGDPPKGKTKALYAIWKYGSGPLQSGVSFEGSKEGFTIQLT